MDKMQSENERPIAANVAWEVRTRFLNELALTLVRAASPGEMVSEARFFDCAGLCTLEARDFPPGCVPVVILRPLSRIGPAD
jgi:hypothetical protein